MSDFEFLGPYRVEAKLGKGGMGTVYRGVHRETGQRVAIKLLAHEMAQEPRFRNRFASEIRTLEKLSHPNIVHLIAWPKDLDDPEKRETYSGPLFYSMELVEGPSLLEHLRKVKRLDWDSTIGYAIEICSALKHAHDNGVYHRDLKPANLLLEPEGHIKLTDFGIAKLFGATEQTAAGSVLGTADYMAPEQASGGPITARTDLYALGSLMYACLAGRPPFGGRNLTRVIHGLKHETPPPLDLVLPDVPPELAELIHELLEKKPEDRPPTALVVGKRLGALRAGLRRRGELTRYDTDSQTLPEVVADKLSSNPILRNPDSGSVSEDPTAAEIQLDGSTGFGIPNQRTVSSDSVASESGFSSSASLSDDELRVRAPDAIRNPRFDTVAETVEASSRKLVLPHDDHAGRNWISIAALTIVLLGLIGAVAWMFRKPSSDELASRVDVAISAGQIKDARSALVEFERIYPGDARIPNFEDQLPALGVEDMVRKLRRRPLGLGVKSRSLGMVEQAWLDAMDVRKKQPALAIEKLSAWLDVYGHRELLDSGIMFQSSDDNDLPIQLVELANAELERLQALPSTELDPQAEQLIALIDKAVKTLSDEELIKFKQGVRSLYGEESWAQPILSQLDKT